MRGGSRSEYVVLDRGSACLQCKRRKKRCDGVKPICGPCHRFGTSDSCEFPRPPSPKAKPKPPPARSKSEAMRAQIRELEEQLAKFNQAVRDGRAVDVEQPATTGGVGTSGGYGRDRERDREREREGSTRATRRSTRKATTTASSIREHSSPRDYKSSNKYREDDDDGDESMDEQEHYGHQHPSFDQQQADYNPSSDDEHEHHQHQDDARKISRSRSGSAGSPSMRYRALGLGLGLGLGYDASSSSIPNNAGMPPISQGTAEELLHIFLRHRKRCCFEVDEKRFAQAFTAQLRTTYNAKRAAANPNEAGPSTTPPLLDSQIHPGLMNAVLLLGCHFALTLSNTAGASGWPAGVETSVTPEMEEYYLQQTRYFLAKSLTAAERLSDFLRGTALLVWFYFAKGRIAEAQYHASGVGCFASACHLNTIDASALALSQAGGASGLSMSIISPPKDSVELEEYVSLFWSVFILDRYASMMCGTACTIRDESVWTPWPRPVVEWGQPRTEADVVAPSNASRTTTNNNNNSPSASTSSPSIAPASTTNLTTSPPEFTPTGFPLIDIDGPLPRGEIAMRAVSVLVLQRAVYLSKAANAAASTQEQGQGTSASHSKPRQQRDFDAPYLQRAFDAARAAAAKVSGWLPSTSTIQRSAAKFNPSSSSSATATRAASLNVNTSSGGGGLEGLSMPISDSFGLHPHALHSASPISTAPPDLYDAYGHQQHSQHRQALQQQQQQQQQQLQHRPSHQLGSGAVVGLEDTLSSQLLHHSRSSASGSQYSLHYDYNAIQQQQPGSGHNSGGSASGSYSNPPTPLLYDAQHLHPLSQQGTSLAHTGSGRGSLALSHPHGAEMADYAGMGHGGSSLAVTVGGVYGGGDGRGSTTSSPLPAQGVFPQQHKQHAHLRPSGHHSHSLPLPTSASIHFPDAGLGDAGVGAGDEDPAAIAAVLFAHSAVNAAWIHLAAAQQTLPTLTTTSQLGSATSGIQLPRPSQTAAVGRTTEDTSFYRPGQPRPIPSRPSSTRPRSTAPSPYQHPAALSSSYQEQQQAYLYGGQQTQSQQTQHPHSPYDLSGSTTWSPSVETNSQGWHDPAQVLPPWIQPLSTTASAAGLTALRAIPSALAAALAIAELAAVALTAPAVFEELDMMIGMSWSAAAGVLADEVHQKQKAVAEGIYDASSDPYGYGMASQLQQTEQLVSDLQRQSDIVMAALDRLSQKYSLVGTCPSSSSSSSRRSSSAPDTCARKVSNAFAGEGEGVARARAGAHPHPPSIDTRANPAHSFMAPSASPRYNEEFLLSATSTIAPESEHWATFEEPKFLGEHSPSEYYQSPSLVDSSSASASADWPVDDFVDFDTSPYQPYQEPLSSSCHPPDQYRSQHSWIIYPPSPFTSSLTSIPLT